MKIKSCLFNSCCAITLLLGLGLVIVELFLLDGLVRSQAEDGIKMSEQTYQLWGVIPGDSKTFTLRNFTMYHFQNPREFIYRKGVKPQFVEIGDFLYQEKSQFLNYGYSEDKEKLHFDYWLYFDQLKQSRNVDQKFDVVNVGPLGFWMQLDSTRVTSFALQGFGGLFLEMSNTIKVQAIGQGVADTFLPTYDIFKLTCGELGIGEAYCWYLWNDRYYGFDNDVNVQFWVKAAHLKDQKTKQVLYEHFYPMPVPQFEGLISEIAQFSHSIENVLNNWFCDEAESCDGYKLTLKQLSSAGVTNNPPPGSQAEESICSTNSTCVGSPEITTFLRKQFKKMYPDQKYQMLTFSEKTFNALFTPYKGLLNIGTLNNIQDSGEKYDQTHDETYLSSLAATFNAQSNDHAFVIWQWIKYMTNQFTLKLSRGGSRKIAGMGGVFSQAWYQVSYDFADWFLRDAYSFLAYKQIGGNCKQVLSFLPAETAAKICQQSLPDTSDYKNYYSLISPCLNSTQYFLFKDKYNLSPLEMQSYCDNDEEPSNIGLVTIQAMKYLSQKYNCVESLPTLKCTEIDIIVKQVFNSMITLDPIDIEGYPYKDKPVVSVNQWNSEIPTFEYRYYLQLAGFDDVQQHLESEARDLFTFDKLLNGPEVQELFMLKNDVQFYQKYHWVNPPYLRNYIRFVVMEVGFGGFTQSRSPKEMFFGYNDPFLQGLQEGDTMQGGDPSISPLIAFNELNMTVEESAINKQVMYSGFGEVAQTRQYVSLFNKSYITFNNSYYDGEQVQWELITPWAEDVQIQGSDGFSVPPNLDEAATPPIFISSIARFSQVSLNQTVTRYDMPMRDYRIKNTTLQSSLQNPDNAKYYQLYRGFLNSSYQGFPLYVSKNHFLDADPFWADMVHVVDASGNQMTASQWDDTKLIVEPYTGTVVSATIYLQSNFLFSPNDILYPAYEETLAANCTGTDCGKFLPLRMLPILNTFRSGNFSEEAFGTFFGDLRTIVNNKTKIALAGWALIALCLIVVVGLKVRREIENRKGPREAKKASLLESQATNIEEQS